MLKLENKIILPSFEEVKSDKKKFAKTAMLIEQEANPFSGKKLIQYHGDKAVIINEQPLPLSTKEFDELVTSPDKAAVTILPPDAINVEPSGTAVGVAVGTAGTRSSLPGAASWGSRPGRRTCVALARLPTRQ